MKKRFLLIVLFTVFLYNLEGNRLYAQSLAIRHVKGMNGIFATLGNNTYGLSYQLGYGYFFSNSIMGRVDANYARFTDTSSKITLDVYGLDINGLYNHPKLVINERVFFNVLGGIVSSYYTPKGNVEGSLELLSVTKFGFSGGVLIETYVTNHLVLEVAAVEKWLFGSSYGANRFFANVGFRYDF